ncbi:type II toxin-antitoxin system HicB family antitoxin [Lamprocystis purpurea]|jgi:predicted RNase H-like HicB family nuclease|uniref:type II toxin-antitoxin system HicB family antitoxin n=1 Tax=Lamprocystis purpurea TaxID=61598 RepID=UPI00035DBDA9|nr:type II toxin-antitoxin system HicB family antitoxin [Lamprocystis purpurea]
MLYPVYVHPGDADHAHGVTIPDFPGCFSAADRWEDLPAKVQEAVEVYCEGEDLNIPEPTPWETIASRPDYQDGVWLLADIDLTRLRARSVRLTVSLPEGLVRRIDAYAKAQHMSRSGFLAKAAAEALERA